jgi:MFS family permease
VFVGIGVVTRVVGARGWLLVRDRTEAGPVAAGPQVDRTVVLGGLLSVLKNRATWPAAAVNFGIAGSFFAFAGLWATPYLLQVQGLSRAVASTHVSIYFAAFAVGCLFMGSLSDRLGRRKPVVLVAAHVYGLIWLVWLSGLAMPVVLSYLLLGLMGLATASFTLTWACAKEVNPPQLSGMSTSVTNMGGFLGGALLQPLVGWAIVTTIYRFGGLRLYQQLRPVFIGLFLGASTATLATSRPCSTSSALPCQPTICDSRP